MTLRKCLLFDRLLIIRICNIFFNIFFLKYNLINLSCLDLIKRFRFSELYVVPVKKVRRSVSEVSSAEDSETSSDQQQAVCDSKKQYIDNSSWLRTKLKSSSTFIVLPFPLLPLDKTTRFRMPRITLLFNRLWWKRSRSATSNANDVRCPSLVAKVAVSNVWS